MKTCARVHGLVSRVPGGIPPELLERLCDMYPEGRTGKQGHVFESRLSIDDSRTVRILSALEDAGYRPWADKSRPPIMGQEFGLQLERVYDDAGLAACEYLELCPIGKMYVPGDTRVGGRKVSQISRPGKTGISLLGMGAYTYIAVQRARDALEAASLKGLKFLPVEKSYESVDYDLYDEEDTWWELESDIELPRLASSMTLRTRDGRPFRGDFSEGCIRREGFYTHPELHYRRAGLERLGPFDAARTWEHFHPRGPAPMSRAFVVSKRFYDVCMEHNIKSRWVPVHLDD
jgi:hypothetical protein